MNASGPVLLIDNYDSFTWNVYQLFALAGADVIVYRNDQITVEEAISLAPSRLVISPGPGHPSTDSGVSSDLIKQFSGVIPILGVCMGAQCIYTLLGGVVDSVGQIVHGKTSTIKHDGKHLYENVPQNISVTRYHSLAGERVSLPAELEVTSWTEDGIIMGIRHKTLTIEGVQFHPESVLSEQGEKMIRNFLSVTDGKWGSNVTAAQPSILDKIYSSRKVEVDALKATPGCTMRDLEAEYKLGLAPDCIDLYQRLQKEEKPALLAEIKRASPSKGIIKANVVAASCANTYAVAGAAVISVLTEPKWFKGNIRDLTSARAAVNSRSDRPAILRKEFIFDRYQILEARLAGADTVLLIVKMLPDALLKDLYEYSRSIGMEPLVEVNDAEEMKRACILGAKVIGVNNRDLHSFKVDLSTTTKLLSLAPKDSILCGLSGITCRDDVEKLEREGVHGVLVGEALMKAKDIIAFARALKGRKHLQYNSMVKICGTRNVECAKVALDNGADMVGMIFDDTARRLVDLSEAKKITELVKSYRKHLLKLSSSTTLDELISNTPLSVGVFRNQSLETIRTIVKEVGLDIVQLHGQEPIWWAKKLTVPVIHKFLPGEWGCDEDGFHVLPLLDAGAGTGEKLDWEELKKENIRRPFILAGGLNKDNVREALATGAICVDVSSGIETDGQQDPAKIKQFIDAVRHSG